MCRLGRSVTVRGAASRRYGHIFFFLPFLSKLSNDVLVIEVESTESQVLLIILKSSAFCDLNNFLTSSWMKISKKNVFDIWFSLNLCVSLTRTRARTHTHTHSVYVCTCMYAPTQHTHAIDKIHTHTHTNTFFKLFVYWFIARVSCNFLENNNRWAYNANSSGLLALRVICLPLPPLLPLRRDASSTAFGADSFLVCLSSESCLWDLKLLVCDALSY
jgi:hypothetical protein